ncbi:MAG TPA: histidine kinase dimerization/phosphoacceptor domain -containing protein [Xanthobacteraceae bacterium]|nr:histidine kinase dimerization/phosphoacceptor domain -containing protein [Xanthobacteraceae bacterium]
MLNTLLEFCTSNAGMLWLNFYSDLAIAVAYFAIPITMAVVLRNRKDDIPYPWLWLLFVTFIVACGMTHLVHVWSVLMGAEYLPLQVSISIFTAIASVGTAIAFAFILPQIKNLPSPRQQKAQLERLVAERTREKDQLIREINHRVGNQLQVISSAVSIEARRAKDEESIQILQRLRAQLDTLGKQHGELSRKDYLEAGIIQAPAEAPATSAEPLRVLA